MNRKEHIKFLREVDERVLPRRDIETDEEYAKRMYSLINSPNFHDKSEPAPDPRGPFFLTQWEREDYEREKRGEKPLGPFISSDEARRLEQEEEFMRDLKESERTDRS